MARTDVPFRIRAETLGFETTKPWSLDALYLLFSAPRVFEPLVDAWDARRPGTRRAISRLAELGLVAHQPAVIVDTITGEVAHQIGKPVLRYRITAAGRRMLEAIEEDSLVLHEFTPKTTASNRLKVLALLRAFDTEATDGVSQAYAVRVSGLAGRTGRWWVGRMVDEGLVRQLPTRVPDVREVVPAHWRPTRLLARHLTDICREHTLPGSSEAMIADLRLNRSRYLDDIDPARVTLSGATDYDHDVGTQRTLAHMLRSERFVAGGLFQIEPRLRAPLDDTQRPWRFGQGGSGRDIYYQPDAQYREYTEAGLARSLLEYERYQTRRDGWGHIERFCGWLYTSVPAFEPVVLRFVVDSVHRARSYTELIEAFVDWQMRRPELTIPHNVTLAVASAGDLEAAPDPLHPEVWWRIKLPSGNGQPVLHPRQGSPYERYFSGS